MVHALRFVKSRFLSLLRDSRSQSRPTEEAYIQKAFSNGSIYSGLRWIKLARNEI